MTDATTPLGWGFFGPVLTATYLWGSWRAYWLLIRVRSEQKGLTFRRYSAAVDIAIALLLPVAVAIILWHRHTATRAYQIACTVLRAYGIPRPQVSITDDDIAAAAAELRMRRPTGLFNDKVRGHLEHAWSLHQQKHRTSSRW